jgi:hypothetical protein
MAKSKAVTRKCVGHTRAGKPCRNKPMRGRDVCPQHPDQTRQGQPTKLNEQTTTAILNNLASGVGIEKAAAYAGIGARTVCEWVERGRADQEAGNDTGFSRFSQDVTRTRAQVQIQLAAQVRAQASDDWRAAAWMLERLAPGEFGQHQVVEHTGSVELEVLGGAQPVDVPAGKRERMIAIMLEDEPELVDATVVEE